MTTKSATGAKAHVRGAITGASGYVHGATKSVKRAASGHFSSKSTDGSATTHSNRELLDERSQRLLHMSGAEFVQRYRSGDLPDTPTVTHLSMLIGPREG